jgi:hypothetical protein
MAKKKHIGARGGQAPICPYCSGESILSDNRIIYGRKYGHGLAYVCEHYPDCDSYCGTHKDGTPLGTLANKELRDARKGAHIAFDRLWKEGHYKRRTAYMFLAVRMGLTFDETHIAMMTVNQCRQVRLISAQLYKEATRKKK